jgi:hypothetical protein
MSERHIPVGSRVRVSARHWLRANHLGAIIEFDAERSENRYLVEFETARLGGGIDGNKLWLNDAQFTVVDGTNAYQVDHLVGFDR